MGDSRIVIAVIVGILILGTLGLSDDVYADPGQSINVVASPTSPFNFVADSDVAIGTDGFPVVTYWELGTVQDLMLVHCTSIDCSTKDSPVSLDIVGTSGPRPSIVIGVDGFPIISYHVSLPGLPHTRVVHCTSIDCSTFDSPVTIDSTITSSGGSIAIGNDGFPVISYADNFSVAKLQFVHCTSIDCSTFDSPRVLDSDTRVGTASSVAIGIDGFPVISYAIINNLGMRVLHCTSIDCSTFDSPKTLEGTACNICGPDMTLGSDGFPILTYREDFSNEQRILHCTSNDCSSHDPPKLIDGGVISPFSSGFSIEIGVDNFPIVSYIANELSGSSLKFVHCSSIDCSSFDSPKILDIGAGSPSSLAIGNDGFPVISYPTFNDILLLHCLAINCDVPVNNPPICEDATPNIGNDVSSFDSAVVATSSSSPTITNIGTSPSHKTVEIGLSGVTDPDGDPITLTIDGITQDEPTTGSGQGDKSPDGFGIGTDSALVRAERLGTGDGRIYEISFTADDGNGGMCSSSVFVGVPHDNKKDPIDSGQFFDSTLP